MKKVFLTLFVLFFGISLTTAAINYDVSVGTSAPPPTLGGYTMTTFPLDGRAIFADYASVPSPLGGDIIFSYGVNHRQIGNGWGTWSHGYTGDVYYTNGGTSISILLPNPTSAFYFYAEPNPFSVWNITATANDGTNITVAVNGSYGASYFGFYSTGGTALTSITISGGVDFAFGEFGISSLPTQDQNITFSNIKPNQMNMAWTRGNGNGSFVVVKEGSALVAGDQPVNYSTYSTYNSNYTSAPTLGTAKIAYYGSGNSILLTGLTKLARYYIQSFAYNGDPAAGTGIYNPNPATGNPVNQRTSRYKHTLLEDETNTYSFDIGDLYPLPTTDIINFNLNVLSENSIRAEIYDESGRRLFVEEKAFGTGDYIYSIPVKNFGTGTYILKMSSDNDNIVVPFIINR